MRIKLAGFNVDADILGRLRPGGRGLLTPETISAAYARISRSSLSVDQLRKKACLDVAKARNSNQKIIFAMGHHSVAEHAVFNFDIMGISRLALEEIEQFRLVSYTEKSQRYVTLEGELVLPAEIRQAGHKKLFQTAAQRQNRFYFKAFALLAKRLRRRHPDKARDAAGQKLLESWAKEDARYILPLASGGQVGMTVNARNLEHMFRRLRLSSRAEVRELGEKLYALVLPVAPSLILFPEPTAFDREAYSALDDYFAKSRRAGPPPGLEPEIVSFTENGDDMILAAHASARRGLDFRCALDLVKKAAPARKKAMMADFFRKVQFFSAMPREFEMADITFQALVSAACFAQLKRHRMATLLPGDYSPALGNTCPESIAEAGLEKEFAEIIEAANHAYAELRGPAGAAAADYILTNSHRRPVLMKMNLREMYHFARLRDDEHAQWDIRALARSLTDQVRSLMPLTALMLCGKSRFDEEYEKIFSCRPVTGAGE